MSFTPTAQSRRLAAELRNLRDTAGLTIEQAASQAQTTLSRATLSRIETSKTGVQPRTVAALLRLYNVSEADAEALVELARSARQHSWWYDYAGTMPKWFASYVAFENSATQLRVYDIQLVNGLLQTEAYARALIAADHPEEPPEKIDERVELRIARQQILRRDKPPRLWIVMDEAALCRTIGGPEVMAAQLQHVAQLAQLPTVTIQVLRFSQGAHMAMGASFTILDFENGDPAVVYLENISGSLFLDKAYHVEGHSLAFDHLRATALSPADTVTLLRTRAEAVKAQAVREGAE